MIDHSIHTRQLIFQAEHRNNILSQQCQTSHEELTEINAKSDETRRQLAETAATSSSLLHALRITVRVCNWRMLDLADQKR